MNLDMNEFSKNKTMIAKGLAILLMLIHHLFAFPEWITQGEYISLFSMYGNNIEYLIGGFGKICVSMYLFLSGYGLYKTYENKNLSYKSLLNRALKFIINYWIIFFMFIPIGFIMFKDKYSFDMLEFFRNLFALQSTYNGNWWFVGVYIILVILFPIIRYIVNRKNIIQSIIGIICVHMIYYATFLIDNIIPSFTYFQNIPIYKVLVMALAYQINFSIGCLFAKYNIFDMIKLKFKKVKMDNFLVYMFIIVLVFILRLILPNTVLYKIALQNIVTIDVVLAPIFIYCATNILDKSKVENVFILLGKHSTNLWLIHGFLCTYYFQRIIYLPKYSIIILLWLILLCLICSKVVNSIYYTVINKMSNKPYYKSNNNI